MPEVKKQNTSHDDNTAHLHDIQTQSMLSATSGHTRSFDLQCGNKTVNFSLSFPPRLLKLSDLLPMARNVCDKMVETAILDQNVKPTCTKGCAHCCSYAVPISHPEADMIHQEISRLPDYKRKSLMAKSLRISKKILKSTPNFSSNIKKEEGLYEISAWYTSLNEPCPFLSDSKCAIYGSRPLACREYMVKSPAGRCKLGSRTQPEKILTPTSVTRALSNTSCKLKSLKTSAILLPFIFPWVDTNKQIIEQVWPAELLVDTFINELKLLSQETQNDIIEQNLVETNDIKKSRLSRLSPITQDRLSTTHAY